MEDTRSASRASETDVMPAGTVTVRYWAAARAAVGTASEEVAVESTTTLAALRAELTRAIPRPPG